MSTTGRRGPGARAQSQTGSGESVTVPSGAKTRKRSKGAANQRSWVTARTVPWYAKRGHLRAHRKPGWPIVSQVSQETTAGALTAGLMARAWRAAGPLQGWLAWRLHARFGAGVTGVVRASDGRVLLLRHRLWPAAAQWGFPSGFARRGERFPDTVVREVREETGLKVRVGGLLDLRSGFRYRVEVYYEAVLDGGLAALALDGREVLEARLFPLDGLPAAMPPLHRELALRGQAGPARAAQVNAGDVSAGRRRPTWRRG